MQLIIVSYCWSASKLRPFLTPQLRVDSLKYINILTWKNDLCMTFLFKKFQFSESFSHPLEKYVFAGQTHRFTEHAPTNWGLVRDQLRPSHGSCYQNWHYWPAAMIQLQKQMIMSMTFIHFFFFFFQLGSPAAPLLESRGEVRNRFGGEKKHHRSLQ